MDAFIGEIRTFPWAFAPKGWAFCNGQTLAISQNQALFSLIGITYGGNGTSTFMLPNLQGRAPVHFGPGGGQTNPIGTPAGVETVQITTSTLPAHAHVMNATTSAGTQPNATGNFPAMAASPNPPTVFIYAPTGSGSNVTLAGNSVGMAGGNGAHNNMQPYLVLNFCIAVTGIFPSRS